LALASYDSDKIQACLLRGFSVAVVVAGVWDSGWQKKFVHRYLGLLLVASLFSALNLYGNGDL
jgi:hypothetical protein